MEYARCRRVRMDFVDFPLWLIFVVSLVAVLASRSVVGLACLPVVEVGKTFHLRKGRCWGFWL
jgi:hypothetical protein